MSESHIARPRNKHAKVLYVTGTDTHVGKTIISCALLQAYGKASYSTAAMKPIASGCIKVEGQLFNQDALLLQANASLKLDYDIVNPIAFEPAIAPHIAAQETDFELSADLLVNHAQAIINQEVDLVLIEGAGGWLVPLNSKETLADFAKAINASVILVVAIRLGCINHALLSVNAIEQQGLELAGWVANLSDSHQTNTECDSKNGDQENGDQENRDQENIATLQEKIAAPLLAVTPWVKFGADQEKINALSECFNDVQLIKIVDN